MNHFDQMLRRLGVVPRTYDQLFPVLHWKERMTDPNEIHRRANQVAEFKHLRKTWAVTVHEQVEPSDPESRLLPAVGLGMLSGEYVIEEPKKEGPEAVAAAPGKAQDKGVSK